MNDSLIKRVVRTAWIPGLIFVLLIALTVYRTVRRYQPPGKFDTANQGYCDFHNGIYYPALAWREGVNPYGQYYADNYPVDRQIPAFSPIVLALHAPLTWLPLRAAEVVYFLLSTGLLFASARLLAISIQPRSASTSWSKTLWIASLLALSRPGHVTLFNGYFTWELAWGTLMAVHYGKTRPTWAAVGLMLAAGKPTYALPLGFLLLCRGHFRTVVLGTALSIVGAGLSVGWLVYHHEPRYESTNEMIDDTEVTGYARGVKSFKDELARSQEIHEAEAPERPVNSWTRVDLLALVAKWIALPREGVIVPHADVPRNANERHWADPNGAEHLMVMLGLMLVPGWLLWRQRNQWELVSTDITAAVVIVTMLISIYHQSGDLMVSAAPLVGLVAMRREQWPALPSWLRYALVALLVIPLFNYAASGSLLARLQLTDYPYRFFSSVSSLAIVAVWVALIAMLGWNNPHNRQNLEGR